MKHCRYLCLLSAVLALTLAAGPVLAAKKVVVISGLTEEKARVANFPKIFEGIEEAFKGTDVQTIYQYVNTDLKSEEEKASAGEDAIHAARQVKPDLIITLGDGALKYVGSKIDDTPVVFSFVFGAPNTLGMPKSNATGIIRTSYAADIWTLAHRLYGSKTVALISKDGASMRGVKRVLSARAGLIEKKAGVLYQDMYLVNTFEEWRDTVLNFSYDFIYLADTSRIVKGGNEMSKQELIAWTVANSKVPVIAATEADVEAGALYAIVTSEKTNGQMAAEEALKILNGAAPDQVYKQSTKGKLVVNLKTAQFYKTEIPYDILSTAEKVYE